MCTTFQDITRLLTSTPPSQFHAQTNVANAATGLIGSSFTQYGPLSTLAVKTVQVGGSFNALFHHSPSLEEKAFHLGVGLIALALWALTCYFYTQNMICLDIASNSLCQAANILDMVYNLAVGGLGVKHIATTITTRANQPAGIMPDDDHPPQQAIVPV